MRNLLVSSKSKTGPNDDRQESFGTGLTRRCVFASLHVGVRLAQLATEANLTRSYAATKVLGSTIFEILEKTRKEARVTSPRFSKNLISPQFRALKIRST
jgi:hypothetical protein